jgi:hypothetical protein
LAWWDDLCSYNDYLWSILGLLRDFQTRLAWVTLWHPTFIPIDQLIAEPLLRVAATPCGNAVACDEFGIFRRVGGVVSQIGTWGIDA